MSSFTEAWLSDPNAGSFYTRTYAPASGAPRAVVVFIHGFIEHIARYEYVHARWAAHGIATFAFDQRGFGRTATDPAHKAPGAVYGNTSDADAIADIAWALRTAREAHPGVPLFLMGHSMVRGTLVLSFPTRADTQETTKLLSGVIATGAHVRLTKPSPLVVRWVLKSGLPALLPNQNVPAVVEAKYLSHDPAVLEAYDSDPLVRKTASLRTLDGMFKRADGLNSNDYQKWPVELPVSRSAANLTSNSRTAGPAVHGSEDMVRHIPPWNPMCACTPDTHPEQMCSVDAAKEFCEKLPAKDKNISVYEGGYHELQNEPDGVREKFVDECIAWVEARAARFNE
ncbi:lysophospholipase [Gloeopeniophorella convolvens]|nr:lysophospholipase [Gloeopeniophorella convolvens]